MAQQFAEDVKRSEYQTKLHRDKLFEGREMSIFVVLTVYSLVVFLLVFLQNTAVHK
jgi:hypothetical protein